MAYSRMPSIACWASPKGASGALESVTGPPLRDSRTIGMAAHTECPAPGATVFALELSGALICRLVDDKLVRETITGRGSTGAAGRRRALRLVEGGYAGTAGATPAFCRRRWERRSSARYTTGVVKSVRSCEMS